MDAGERGYTLIELMFALAILAGLLAWSVPTFGDLRRNAARTTAVNEFVQAVYFARSEAIKRNGVVSLCPSRDAQSCDAAGAPWHAGWIVFINHDRDNPAVRDGSEPLLRTHAAWTTGRIVANRTTLSFRPYGQSGVTATVVFCDDRGARDARAVIISQTGRPRVTGRDASGGALSCA